MTNEDFSRRVTDGVAVIDDDNDISVRFRLDTSGFGEDGSSVYITGLFQGVIDGKSTEETPIDQSIEIGAAPDFSSGYVRQEGEVAHARIIGAVTVYTPSGPSIENTIPLGGEAKLALGNDNRCIRIRCGSVDDDGDALIEVIAEQSFSEPFNVSVYRNGSDETVAESDFNFSSDDRDGSFWAMGLAGESSVKVTLKPGRLLYGPSTFDVEVEVVREERVSKEDNDDGDEYDEAVEYSDYEPLLDGVRRTYAINVGRYGGELVIGRVSSAFVDFWIGRDEFELEEFLSSGAEEVEGTESPDITDCGNVDWSEIDDIEHVNCVYADCAFSVSQVELADEVSIQSGQLVCPDGLDFQDAYNEGDVVYEGNYDSLYGREAYFQEEGEPVLLFHTSEKGFFGTIFIETIGEFDPSKFMAGVLETPIGEFAERFWYAGEELEPVTDFSSTLTKSAIARVGYMNLEWHDNRGLYSRGSERLSELLNEAFGSDGPE